MAKYLDTSQISSELMQLLKEANERIILVTYSLQVNTQIQERLKTKSKIGTLAEITLIYGNTKPKKAELEWMAEVDDLKVWQKKNLHAKCFVNENKAIISSMNLYDYSQTTNVEMGVLITKQDDPDAYKAVLEDIADLRINGDRVKPWLEEDRQTTQTSQQNSTPSIPETKSEIELSYLEQIKCEELKHFRKELSHEIRQKQDKILSDTEIIKIVTHPQINKKSLKTIIKSEKRVKDIGREVIEILNELDNMDHTFGEIVDTRYQDNRFNYDQIKMKRFDDNSIQWYDTKKELPKIGSIVVVDLNGNWFNDYYILKKSSKPNQTNTETQKDSIKDSPLCSTKELSEILGESSRQVNNLLVENNLMYKKDGDWIATKKGKSMGAVERDGQYGQFILWPESIADTLDLPF